MQDLKGRTAVITGAAGGFGLAFARRALASGMRLVMADVEADALARAQRSLPASDGKVVTRVTDVAQAGEVDALAALAFQTFGEVHLLFNNAGVAPVGLLWDHTAEDWQWALGVNVLGVAHGIRSFVPKMLRQTSAGHIVNTASVAGFISPTTMGLYNVTKHAVVTLSETLYHDLRSVGSGIGVTVLCPAFVPTGIAHSERNRPQHLQSSAPDSPHTARAREAMRKAVGSGRLTADDIAYQTFEAIAERRFYLFTHPAILGSVKDRHESIQAGAEPSDPFARKPALTPVQKGEVG